MYVRSLMVSVDICIKQGRKRETRDVDKRVEKERLVDEESMLRLIRMPGISAICYVHEDMLAKLGERTRQANSE